MNQTQIEKAFTAAVQAIVRNGLVPTVWCRFCGRQRCFLEGSSSEVMKAFNADCSQCIYGDHELIGTDVEL